VSAANGGIRFGPLYIVSEGLNDRNFLERLLNNRGIDGFSIGNAKGKDDWRPHLSAVQGSTDRTGLRGLIVVGDNDHEPDLRFRSICDALRSERFPAPGIPGEIIDGPPVTSVVMLPGPGTVGCLETILTDAVLHRRPELGPCLDRLQDCVPVTRRWTEPTQAKLRLHTAIAVSCDEDPSAALAYVWGKRGNPIPIESPTFNDLADFLRSFRDRVLRGHEGS